jgi:hypothetical protein
MSQDASAKTPKKLFGKPVSLNRVPVDHASSDV